MAYSLEMLKHRKGITIVNIICNSVIFSYSAGISFCVRQILNIIESNQGFSLALVLPYLAAILAGLAIVRIAAIMSCACLDAQRAYYYQNRVRLNVLRLLLGKKDINRVAGKSGQIFEVLDHDIPVSSFPAELLTEVTGHFVYTLIALAMLLAINWQLTLFIFLPLSAAIYGVQKLSHKIKENRRENRAAHDEASSFTGDAVAVALTIKALGAEEAVLKQYDRVNSKRRLAALRDTIFNEKINAFLNASVYIGTGVMMIAAARIMTDGEFGIGDFSLFIAHLDTLADCVNRIVELVAESRRAEVSHERICKTVDDNEESSFEKTLNAGMGVTLNAPMLHNVDSLASGDASSKTAQAPDLPLLEVNNLSYNHSDKSVFNDISFRLKPGELAVIGGELGSGKSTLLNVLMGILPAEKGEILINGKPYSANGNRDFISGAPQRSGFFSASLKENLCLGFPASQVDMVDALSNAALDEFASQIPGSLDMDLGNGASRLSGGQQQRLALARVFLRKPRILIIDDCVSALDKETRLELLRRLRLYLRQRSCGAVIATNDIAFRNAADMLLLMEESS